MKAISIRQPWAWLCANGYKDLENRVWDTKFRGQVLIHAAKGLTKHEYWNVVEFARSIDPLLPLRIPNYDRIDRGGIVGVASISGSVRESESPWFSGPIGFQLTDARPLSFVPMKGRLMFFHTGLLLENLESSAV